MARKVIPLSDTQVKNAKPKTKVVKLSDGDGLQLQIKPTGSKSWIFNYTKPLIDKRTTISFGTYPEVTLSAARKLRANAKELLAKDIDPKSDRESKKLEGKEALENTFGVWANKWFEIKLGNVKELTATRNYNSLKYHFFSYIENTPIADLRPAHIEKPLENLIKAEKRETAKRACAFINEIMMMAKKSGAIEFNRLDCISKGLPRHTVKHQLTIPPEELPELMQMVLMADISKTTLYMFLLQLHCITRPMEAARMKWEYVNFDKKVITIPEDMMKSKVQHIIPMSDQVFSLLQHVKNISGHRPYLFPSVKDPLSHANSQTVNVMLKRNGYKKRLVSHGLRAIASTYLNSVGKDYDVIEAALAHLDKNVVRRSYNRTDYIDRRRELMQFWSDYIDSCSKLDGSIYSLCKVK